ncbi:MAG: cache domain-containing protein [Nitrospinota bacterium]|nr:cache domain-containing protein [Nitrospinota bacterium]
MLKHFLKRLYALALVIMLLPLSCSGKPDADLKNSTFKKLSSMRTAKKETVISHLERLFKKASRAGEDKIVVDYFFRHRSSDKSLISANPLYSADETSLEYYYVKELHEFYDILFIDSSGFIFSTIRKEADYRKNIFEGDLAKSRISTLLKSDPYVRFVDYDYYAPSKEAASFIINPVKEKGELAGWIAFQYSINTINALLTDVITTGELGNTGEIYLVNEENLMLSQSRFFPTNTIMNFNVDTESLKKAIGKNEGEIISEDYRGVRVFSSFEKFSFMGNNWIIVSEVDEDEVITKHFRENMEYFINRMYKKLSIGYDDGSGIKEITENLIKVDINEYASGKKGEALSTLGISTCTGLVISYPGRFTYLGHIYPLDSTFFSSFERSAINILYKARGELFGDGTNDLLGNMFREIREFKIYPYEKRELKAVIVAVHTDNLKTIIERLLDFGFMLSQITIVYSSDMDYANIYTRVGDDSISIAWINEQSQGKIYTNPANNKNLGEIFKEISGYSLN